MLTITLYGAPVTKKNSQQIVFNPKTGKPFVIQSERYRQYERDCLLQIATNSRHLHQGEPLAVQCIYFPPDRRKRDLTNLLAATHDILQKAEVIQDDSCIQSLDGSRIAAPDKLNPRVEITIIKI